MLTPERLPVTSNDLANTFHLRTLYIGPRAGAPNPTVGAYMTLPITHDKMTFAQLRAIAMSVLQRRQITGSGPMAQLLTTENVPLFNAALRRLKLGYDAQHPFRLMPQAWLAMDPVIMFSIGDSDAPVQVWDRSTDYIVEPPHNTSAQPYDKVMVTPVYLGPRKHAPAPSQSNVGHVTVDVKGRRFTHADIRMAILSALSNGEVRGQGRIYAHLLSMAGYQPQRGPTSRADEAKRDILDVIRHLRMGTAQYPLNMLDPVCPDPVLVVEFTPVIQ